MRSTPRLSLRGRTSYTCVACIAVRPLAVLSFEKAKTAEADLKRSLEQFQAAEQRAAQSYQNTTKGTLTGQIFVATQGAENYKFGAVQVALFARNSIDMLVPVLKNFADSKIQEQTEESDFYQSGAFYFSYLHSPIQSAETDADGRFRIEVPRTGSFVIAAQAEQWVARYPAGTQNTTTGFNPYR
jgi:hypothetical protein